MAQADDTQAKSQKTITGVPEGLDALVLAQLVNEAQSDGTPGTLLHVAREPGPPDALRTISRRPSASEIWRASDWRCCCRRSRLASFVESSVGSSPR